MAQFENREVAIINKGTHILFSSKGGENIPEQTVIYEKQDENSVPLDLVIKEGVFSILRGRNHKGTELESFIFNDVVDPVIGNPEELTDFLISILYVVTANGVVATQPETDTEVIDDKFVSPLKLGAWFTNVRTRILIWAGQLTFSLSPIFSTLGISQVVETDANKKLISTGKKTAHNKDFGTAAGTITEGNDSRLNDSTPGGPAGGDLNGTYPNPTLNSASVKSKYESNANTNEFSDAEQTKLSGIEVNATADQTDAEIRAAVEAATDSNIFTDADHSKLDGLTPEWLDIWRKSATNDQTGIDEGTDILFDGSRGEGITYDTTTGIVTLKANRVYRLWATFAVFSIASSDTVAVQWVKASDNTPLEEGHETRLRPQSSSSNGNNQPTIEVIYKPTVDTDVKLRVTQYTGTPDTITMYWDRAMGTVMRIN